MRELQSLTMNVCMSHCIPNRAAETVKAHCECMAGLGGKTQGTPTVAIDR